MTSKSKIPLSALRWRCRRGMLELDQLLLRFLDQHYENLTVQQSQQLMRLLETEDDRLWAWLSGRADPVSRDDVTPPNKDEFGNQELGNDQFGDNSWMNALVDQIRLCG